jgi:hypothetical protein
MLVGCRIWGNWNVCEISFCVHVIIAKLELNAPITMKSNLKLTTTSNIFTITISMGWKRWYHCVNWYLLEYTILNQKNQIGFNSWVLPSFVAIAMPTNLVIWCSKVYSKVVCISQVMLPHSTLLVVDITNKNASCSYPSVFVSYLLPLIDNYVQTIRNQNWMWFFWRVWFAYAKSLQFFCFATRFLKFLSV